MVTGAQTPNTQTFASCKYMQDRHVSCVIGLHEHLPFATFADRYEGRSHQRGPRLQSLLVEPLFGGATASLPCRVSLAVPPCSKQDHATRKRLLETCQFCLLFALRRCPGHVSAVLALQTRQCSPGSCHRAPAPCGLHSATPEHACAAKNISWHPKHVGWSSTRGLRCMATTPSAHHDPSTAGLSSTLQGRECLAIIQRAIDYESRMGCGNEQGRQFASFAACVQVRAFCLALAVCALGSHRSCAKHALTMQDKLGTLQQVLQTPDSQLQESQRLVSEYAHASIPRRRTILAKLCSHLGFARAPVVGLYQRAPVKHSVAGLSASVFPAQSCRAPGNGGQATARDVAVSALAARDDAVCDDGGRDLGHGSAATCDAPTVGDVADSIAAIRVGESAPSHAPDSGDTQAPPWTWHRPAVATLPTPPPLRTAMRPSQRHSVMGSSRGGSANTPGQTATSAL